MYEMILPGDVAEPWSKTCQHCGGKFVALRSNARFCPEHAANYTRNHNRDRNQARTQRRLEHEQYFVAIDGEGVTEYDNIGKAISHKYVLLGSTGCEPLHKNGERLTLLEIFHYLYFNVFETISIKHPDAVYVGFSLGYDWAQWLKDLSEGRASMLLTNQGIAARQRNTPRSKPFPVGLRVSEELEWEFDMLGDTRFQLRPNFRAKHEQGVKEQPNNMPWMYICDTYPFFQTSLLNVIDPEARKRIGLPPYLSDNEYKLVLEGKASRSDARFDPKMIEYNRLENKALSAVMVELNRGLVAAGVRLSKTQYFGPGQAAQAHLNKLKSSGIDLRSETIQQHIPEWFRSAAQQSYYGGWSEIFYSGIYPGRSFAYDINSAYPKIMSALPCLLHGTYRRGYGDPHKSKTFKGASFGVGDDRVLCLVDARVSGSHPRIGAMLHRRDDGMGSILRPRKTEGWFWLHELEAAQRAGLVHTIEYFSWRAYFPCKLCSAPPLASVEQLYQDRVELGEQGKNSPEGVGKKLIINSMYGKTAQSVGAPVYGNAVYASLITAGCRTMILDFIATHPGGANVVLMIATDGIVTTSPHPDIEIDKTKLGAWDVKQYNNICLCKPGTYWDDAAREKVRTGNYDALRLKSRGVPMKALARQILQIDDLFRNWKKGDRWPEIVIKSDFKMVSPRQALAWGKWFLCGKVTTKDPVKLRSNPISKRLASGPGWTAPYPFVPTKSGSFRSTPYDHSFGDNLEQGVEYVHPDGELDQQIADVFGGLSE